MSDGTMEQQQGAARGAERRHAPVLRRGGIGRLTGGLLEAPVRKSVQRRDLLYRRALLVADSIAALAAIVLAVTVLGDDALRWTSLLVVPIVAVMSKVIGLYDRDELLLRKVTLDESPALFQLATLYALGIWLLEDLLIDGNLGKAQVLGMWALLFVFALMARALARGIAAKLAVPERCLVVGDLRGTGSIGGKLAGGRAMSAEVVARLPIEFERDHGVAMDALRDAIRKHDAHRVILVPTAADSDAVLDAIRLVKSLGVKVSLLPRLFEVVGSSVVFDDLDGLTVLGVRRFGLTRSSAAVKRTMDLLGAGLGVLLLAPVMGFIALMIRLDSPGPVFYRNDRVGRDGNRFPMLKFRTMVVGADSMKDGLRSQNDSEGLFKLEDDPRVTRVGGILRKVSLDELPQLLNVIKGDMSLVGPRPLVVDEDALVEGWHRRRLHLTPGMTGPWQILGGTKVPLQEMVKIDYLYIASWSFWTDIKIMLRTVLHMLSRDNV